MIDWLKCDYATILRSICAYVVLPEVLFLVLCYSSCRWRLVFFFLSAWPGLEQTPSRIFLAFMAGLSKFMAAFWLNQKNCGDRISGLKIPKVYKIYSCFSANATVTREIKLFQNYLSLRNWCPGWNNFAQNYFKVISEAYCNSWILSSMFNVEEIILK